MTLEDHDRENLISLYSEAMDTYGRVDRVAEEVVQLIHSSGEHRIACRRGCNTCCMVFVRVTFAEAAAIAQWLADPASDVDARGRVDALYRDPLQWGRRSLLNMAGMGAFSSDRTIAEYARTIWHTEPLRIGSVSGL